MEAGGKAEMTGKLIAAIAVLVIGLTEAAHSQVDTSSYPRPYQGGGSMLDGAERLHRMELQRHQIEMQRFQLQQQRLLMQRQLEFERQQAERFRQQNQRR
jgi:hypothetical protein